MKDIVVTNGLRVRTPKDKENGDSDNKRPT
jgi:hypothetical protein